MEGIKHLVSCHCMLPQYANRKNPLFHKFIVFSEIDDNDAVVPKIVSCNNCGAVHKITEIGKSEISIDRNINSQMTKEDIASCLPDNLTKILDSYKVDLSTWEEAKFYIDNQKWGSTIVLVKDEEKGIVQGKVLHVLGSTSFRIETFVRNDEVE